MEELNETKKNKLTKIILFAVISLALLICLILIIVKFISSEDESYKEGAQYTTSFFIKNKKGKIALYNEKGKKLSDFIYENAGTFYNGVAFVMKKDASYAVINEKGKEVIKSDKYDTFSDYNGFFKAKKGSTYYLLSSKGDEIIKGDSLSINTYNKFSPFALVNSNKTFYIYTNDGTKLISFKEQDGVAKPTVSHLDNYASIFYDGKTTVFNLKEKKTITSIKGKDQYCVNNISKDNKVITLNSCTSWFSTASKADNHGVIYKDKFIDLSKKCKNFNVYENTIVCSSDEGAYILKFNGNKVEYSKNIRSNAAFYDYNNYAIRNTKTNKVEFYKNGKLKASIKGSLSALGRMDKNIYLVSDDKGFAYYNINGKKIIDKKFESARAFDKNGNAIVGDSKQYYLINEKGKTISDKFANISISEDYYLVSNIIGNKGVINSKGKKIIDLSYSNITIKKRYNSFYAIALGENNLKDVYNLDKKKKILSSTGDITFTNNIIKVSEKNTKIYNYNGKLIYSEK